MARIEYFFRETAAGLRRNGGVAFAAMSTAFIAVFLAAGIFNIAGGIPLNPLQILWLNMVVDIPIAIALGFDEATPGLMQRKPRPVGAPVLSPANWVRLCIQGAVMTVGSLVAYQVGDHRENGVVAATMLLTTLSLYHLVAGIMARDQRGTIFDRSAIPGPLQLRRYGLALVAIVAVTTIGFLQRIADTTELRFPMWCVCIALAAALLVVEELIKLVLRRREPDEPEVEPEMPRVVSALRPVPEPVGR